MTYLANIAVAAVLAALIGLGGTWYALSAKRGVETIEIGPWRATIEIAPGGTNPYVRAVLARTGEVPMLATEAIVFRANEDGRGRPLRGKCVYRLRSGWMDARGWTLTVTDPKGHLLPEGTSRHTVNSSEVLRDEAGRFEVVLAPVAHAGNWLSSEGTETVAVTLRLYDTPLYVNGGLYQVSLPEIEAEPCS